MTDSHWPLTPFCAGSLSELVSPFPAVLSTPFQVLYLLRQFPGAAGTAGQTQQKRFVFSQFWQLEVQDRGVGKPHSSSGFWERLRSMPTPSFCRLAGDLRCSLACNRSIVPISAFILTCHSPCIYLCLTLLLSKDTSHPRLGPTPRTSSWLITSAMTLFAKKVALWGTRA